MTGENEPLLRESLPQRVTVIEVGPRDGFQMEKRFLPTELKVEAIEQLGRAGLSEIEATSFVHPRVVPQMSDAAAVLDRLDRLDGVRYWALVPNTRGAELALEHGAGGVHLVICASETYNQRNVGMSVAQSMAALAEIVRRVDGAAPVAVTMAATFGCPFEGQLPTARLLEIARQIEGSGADELGLADSAGLGHPMLVREVVRRVGDELPSLPLRFHLHDTRGLGLANAMVGLEEGIERFDTAFGGMGGCPVIAGATGNIATEDFVNLLEELGVGPGVDLKRVRRVSLRLQEFLERPLPAKLLASGTRSELLELNRESLSRS